MKLFNTIDFNYELHSDEHVKPHFLDYEPSSVNRYVV